MEFEKAKSAAILLERINEHERDWLRNYYKRHDKLTEASNAQKPTKREL